MESRKVELEKYSLGLRFQHEFINEIFCIEKYTSAPSPGQTEQCRLGQEQSGHKSRCGPKSHQGSDLTATFHDIREARAGHADTTDGNQNLQEQVRQIGHHPLNRKLSLYSVGNLNHLGVGQQRLQLAYQAVGNIFTAAHDRNDIHNRACP